MPRLIYGPVKTHVVFNLLLPESAPLMKCGYECVHICVRVERCACVSLIKMYELGSNFVSMNLLSDKYAFSYTD